jgi:hypothetical protein
MGAITAPPSASITASSAGSSQNRMLSFCVTDSRVAHGMDFMARTACA